MSDYWPLFGLLGVMLAAGFVLTLRDWRIGALLIAAALPFEGLLPGAGAGGMKALMTAVLLGLALHLMRNPALLARALGNLRSGVSLALLALVLWSLASSAWALSAGDALARALTFGGVFLLLHLFALLDGAFLRRAWLVLLASAALTVPVGLAFGGLNAFADEGRFASGGLNPNDYAGLLAVTLFVATGGAPANPPLRAVGGGRVNLPLLAVGGGRMSLPLRVLLGAAVLAGVLLSGSRTALVALVVAPLLHLLLVPAAARRPALHRAAALYAVAAVVLIGAFGAQAPQGEALRARAGTLADYRNADTWAGRLSLWRGGLEMIRERPVLGVGAGNFPVAAARVPGMPRRAGDGRGQVAHNVFVGMAAELGAPGLLLFAAMWVAALRKARAAAAHAPAHDGLLPGLLACLLMSLSLSWEYAKVAYVLMGAALALAPSSMPAAAPVAARALPAEARA